MQCESIFCYSTAVPRSRFSKEIEQDWHAIPTSAFGYQSKRVLDQLRRIEMNTPLRYSTQAVSHTLKALHVRAPDIVVIGIRQVDLFCITERFKALAFYSDESLWCLYKGVQPWMAPTGLRKWRTELDIYQFGNSDSFKFRQGWQLRGSLDESAKAVHCKSCGALRT